MPFFIEGNRIAKIAVRISTVRKLKMNVPTDVTRPIAAVGTFAASSFSLVCRSNCSSSLPKTLALPSADLRYSGAVPTRLLVSRTMAGITRARNRTITINAAVRMIATAQPRFMPRRVRALIAGCSPRPRTSEITSSTRTLEIWPSALNRT